MSNSEQVHPSDTPAFSSHARRYSKPEELLSAYLPPSAEVFKMRMSEVDK